MYFSSSMLAALPALALATPTTVQHDSRTTSTNCIQWEPCTIRGGVNAIPGDCGKLMVPLDYTDKENDKQIALDIYRVPATKSPKKGSILLNHGGPGTNGVTETADFAYNLLAATGGYHDLINVSPRGTNGTLTFECFADSFSRAAGTTLIAGNASNVALGEIWARAQLFDNTCAIAQNETGRFIGTAFTARDHMRVVDALNEDGLLRYWGFSYGTLLGETLVAMFPDKIDKIVLDGVVNPFEYYQNSETELVASIDDVFKGFCEGCVNNPENCSLAGNFTAKGLEEYLYGQLELYKANPIASPNPALPGGGSLIDYSSLKALAQNRFNFPSLWPGLADTFSGKGDQGGGAANEDSDEAQHGIKCGDVLKHTNNSTDLLPTLQARRKLSRFGGDTADQVLAQCAQWQLPAKERYDGDFNVKTKNPILIVNNRYDPVTPLLSAKNVSDTFEGSVLLEQNSYGHISMSQASLCTAKAVRAYFNEGKLPEKGTVCDDVKPKLFSGETGWDDVVEELTDSSPGS